MTNIIFNAKQVSDAAKELVQVAIATEVSEKAKLAEDQQFQALTAKLLETKNAFAAAGVLQRPELLEKQQRLQALIAEKSKAAEFPYDKRYKTHKFSPHWVHDMLWRHFMSRRSVTAPADKKRTTAEAVEQRMREIRLLIEEVTSCCLFAIVHRRKLPRRT